MKAVLRARENVIGSAVVVEEVMEMMLKKLADERKEGDGSIVGWEVGEDDLGIETT